ncbi:REST corepressor 3 [Armadillidium vulgare]|nr:REST corepressor 3 [Armadillidium vulgare]
MVTASSKNAEKDDKKGRSSSPNGDASDDTEKDGDCGMRVGKAYQAEIPMYLPVAVEEYLWLAKDKYGYNSEQALGMLFWHRHDLEKATRDLANFTPFPDEWTTEDKVLFEQAFQFHGKSFHRIRQMLPEKSIAQLVKYYYLWKKTRQRSSLIDRHAKKHAAKLEGNDGGQSAAVERSEDEDETLKPEDTKICSNCTVPATILNETAKGQQCITCYNHWKKLGTLRPTIGPMKRDRQLIKHKRRPPRGMYINHEDLMAMVSPDPNTTSDANSTGLSILKHMENEVIALKKQVQSNKAQVASLRTRIGSESIQTLKPANPTVRLNAKWSNDELLLAVQGVRQFGRNFKAIAEIIGNKTENHVRSFFVTYRKRYDLDAILKEWEEEHGPFDIKEEKPDDTNSTKDGLPSTSSVGTSNSTSSSTRGTTSKSH